MSDVNEWNARIIEEFRANEGKVGGPFEHMPLLLLHTTGARSGAARVNPVAYLEQDGKLYVFASKAGADMSPDWFHNLVAHPEVVAEVGTEQVPVTARALAGDERDRIYAIQSERFVNFREYEEKTRRVIPVVELVRR